MSDDRPEKEDEFSEESERREKPSGDEQKSGKTPSKKEEEKSSHGNQKEEESSHDSSEVDRALEEEFDDFYDHDYDPDVEDDYDYNEIEDYGLENPDERKKPRSAAGRMLSRRRKNDAIDENTESPEEDGMSFLEHLEEFRWTIARSVIAFIIGVVIVVAFHKNIAELIQLPLNRAYGSAEVASKNLITYKAMGVISVFFQIALLGGLTLSMPFMLYFMGSFVAPGLTDKERKVLRPACYTAFLLFLVGVGFAFYIILPLALAFTVRLNQHLGFDIFWAASDYYNMVVWFCLSIGFFFQFPLVVVILVYIGALATETLKRVRRIVFVGLMVFSALVSPGGDPISLAVTTGFMYGLYELAILTGVRIERKKLEAEEASQEDEE